MGEVYTKAEATTRTTESTNTTNTAFIHIKLQRLQSRWWQAEQQKAGANWAGRMIILCVFGRTGDAFECKADLKLGSRQFKGFWGWAGSSPTFSAATASSAVARASAPRSATQSCQAGPPPHAASQAARLSWCQVKSRLHFRREQGVSVAPVGSMLVAARREATHVGKVIKRGKRRHSWTERSVFKAPRKGKKPGGDEEWVATEQVLKQLFEDP